MVCYVHDLRVVDEEISDLSLSIGGDAPDSDTISGKFCYQSDGFCFSCWSIMRLLLRDVLCLLVLDFVYSLFSFFQALPIFIKVKEADARLFPSLKALLLVRAYFSTPIV